jgi:radical SAM superfamily enzyme YgiQ (UPF0313 family)
MSSKVDILMLNPHKSRHFPFGIGILTAILKNNKFKVGIINAGINRLNPVSAAEHIAEINPKIICFTGFLLDFNFISAVSRLVREKLPLSKQIAGGWWSSPIPSIVFEETSIDYIVRGEADLIISDLCRNLLEGKSILDFPGVCYRNNEKKYCIKEYLPLPLTMDELPLPAYELFDMNSFIWTTNRNLAPFDLIFKKHGRYKRMGNKRMLRWFSMYSGRSCYGKCTFCNMAGSIRRNYSPKYVAAHIEMMKDKFNIDVFHFTESLTLSTKRWVKDFCREIINRKINCLYIAFCSGNFDYDNETLSLLSESGCHVVRIGLESGDNRILSKMKKKATVDRHYDLINRLRDHKIHVSGSFILNMPGETAESLNNSAMFIKKSRLHNFNFGFATPYPQTELYKYARDNDFISNEKEYIVKNLCNPRRVPADISQMSIEKYVDKFNFNNLSSKKLEETKNDFIKLQIINRLYYTNRLLFHASNTFSPLAKLVYGLSFIKRNVKCTFSNIKAFPQRVSRRIKERRRCSQL